MSTGRKDDQGKPDLTLVPYPLLEGTARALTDGAERYGRRNYLDLKNAVLRYNAALLRHVCRHVDAVERGEPPLDQDSGMPHLWHASACIAILLDLERHETRGPRSGCSVGVVESGTAPGQSPGGVGSNPTTSGGSLAKAARPDRRPSPEFPNHASVPARLCCGDDEPESCPDPGYMAPKGAD